MKVWLTLVAAVGLFWCEGDEAAKAWRNGKVVVPASCPQGTTYPDGCTKAPVANNVSSGPGTRQFASRTSFFSYAAMSGQTYVQQPQQNIPAVDFPVGQDASQLPNGVTLGTLKDPATGGVWAGTPCAYAAQTVTCSNSSTNVDINGFDFSLHGGIALYAPANFTGQLKIRNSYFYAVAGTPAQSTAGLIYITNPKTLTFEYNVVDSDTTNWIWGTFGVTAPATVYMELAGASALVGGVATDCGTSEPVCVQYNAFLHAPAREYSQVSVTASRFQFNYFEGLCYPVGVFTGFIDDGLGGGSYDAVPGKVLTVTAVSSGGVSVPHGAWGGQVVGPVASLPLTGTTYAVSSQTSGAANGIGVYALSSAGGGIAVPSQTLYSNDGVHGDGFLYSWSTGTQSLQAFVNNVFLDDTNEFGSTSWLTPSETTTTATLTSFYLDMNTEITQKSALYGPSNNSTSSRMVGNNHAINITNVTATRNAMDPTGSFDCWFVVVQATPAGTQTVTGNINLIDILNTNMNPATVTSPPSTPPSCTGHL